MKNGAKEGETEKEKWRWKGGEGRKPEGGRASLDRTSGSEALAEDV